MKMVNVKSLLGGRRLRTIILVVVAFIAGYFLNSLLQTPAAGPEHEHPGPPGRTVQTQQWWTCSMHPHIRQPKPGKCPICFMDLIPIAAEDSTIGERQITFSEEALKLMEIQTTPVERKFVEAEIRMVGKIDYDETRVKNITAWVPRSVRATTWLSFTVLS